MADFAAVNGNTTADTLKSSKLARASRPIRTSNQLAMHLWQKHHLPTIRLPKLRFHRRHFAFPLPHTNLIALAGTVAQDVMDLPAKASAEMSNLAAARHTPNYTAATGQPLTHYHSFFSELLSWRNPRASAIAYGSVVSLIFAVRYLDVLRWTLKLTWMVLGITIAAEVAGKLVLNNGFATQLRPRKYYTIHRESLDALIGDVHEFLNFFVIESQRILFVENVYASAAAAVAAFLSYYLVKVVPYWALAIIATTIVFFTPLIYASNQELIDTQLKHASDLVNAQTAQIREAAQKHTEQATQMTKQYMGDYTAKAQALIKGARHHTEEQIKQTTPRTAPDLASSLKATDFPEAPKEDLKVETQPAPSAEAEPLLI